MHTTWMPELDHARAPVDLAPPWVRPVWVGGLELPTNLWLAPLAGWTTLALRELVRGLGGLGCATTEVVSAVEVAARSRRFRQYTETTAADWPLAVQINARTPAEARDAARVVEDGGYALLDFNLGCPVRKIVRKGGGAALGCSAVEAAEVVHHAVSAVKIPVTAKLRLGWDSAQLTAPDVAKELQAAGVAALAVHGRTRCQAFSGAVDREGIRQTVAAVTVPVFANGDILTVEDIVGMLRDTGAAGVMVGRGVIADPWLFSEAWRRLGVGDAWREPGVQQRADALLQHYTRLLDSRPEPVATAQFRKVLRTISKALGAPEALVARGGLVSNALEVATYIDLLRGLPDGPIVRSNVVPTPKRPVDHW